MRAHRVLSKACLGYVARFVHEDDKRICALESDKIENDAWESYLWRWTLSKDAELTPMSGFLDPSACERIAEEARGPINSTNVSTLTSLYIPT